MEFGDLSENPFSVELTRPARNKRSAVKSAVKLLLIVAAGFSLTLAVTRFTPRWLVQQYTDEFESQTAEEKRRRLVQLADLGEVSIEAMVRALADPDSEVARMAFDLLVKTQNDWTVMTESQKHRCHSTLARSIQDIAVHLPDDRTGWVSTLLQETIQTTVNRRDEASRSLFDEASRTMDMLALSTRPGPSILDNETVNSAESRLLVVRNKPLPVAPTENGQWTDWPPPAQSNLDRSVGENNQPQTDTSNPASTSSSQEQLAESPSVYRSSSTKLRPVGPDQPVILHDIDGKGIADSATESLANQSSSTTIQQASHDIDAPLGTFDDRSVMHWLGSEHRELRLKARDELIRRGFREQELSIATQIVSGDRQTRLALVDAISRYDRIDPRPWLLMLLDDESRDVKLRAISVLATMNDPSVLQRLRIRVTEERDPTVAARIRRVLNLR